MKERAKSLKADTVPLKLKSFTKIVNNKENIKTQDQQKKKVTILQPTNPKRTNNLQSIRHRKRKDSLKLESKTQQLRKITQKSKAKSSNGHLKPAHSVELRKNRYIDLEDNRVYSLSAKKRTETRKRSEESLREIVKSSFNKTIQLTPSAFHTGIITQQFHQQKRITMPIQLYQTLNISKKIKSKPNTRRNSQVKHQSIFKDNSKAKKILKKKKGSGDIAWPRNLLQDRISDVLRLSTSEDKGSVVETIQIQQAILTDNDDFDIQQLRQLQSKAKLLHRKNKKLIQGESSNSYFNEMAIKIQRFWRKYKTRKILSRHITPCESYNNTIDVPYQSLQLYGNSIPERHNTYVSHLQDSVNSSKFTVNEVYQSAIKQIKMQELQKWDQLIELVQESIKDNTGTKELLKKLIAQSQINKVDLEENTEQILTKSHKTKSFRTSPKSFKTNSPASYSNKPLQQNYQKLIGEGSSLSYHQIAESPEANQPLQPDYSDKPINQFDRLFNSKGRQRLMQKELLKSEQQQDSLQTRIQVQKLKERLGKLNYNSDLKEGGIMSQEDSPCLRRDRRSLDRDDDTSSISSSEQSQNQEEEIHPKHRLMKLITQDLDKQVVCNEIAENIVFQQMTLLLQDMAISSRLYKQLKTHIKGKGIQQIPKSIKKPQKKLKGMKTNLASVKQYIKSLGDFILNLKEQPLRNLEFPSGPTASQMLRYMRFYDEDDETEDGQNQIILAPQIFQRHWAVYSNTLSFPKSYEQPMLQMNHQDFLKRLTSIHTRAIFDALNQSLDTLRNYGQFGKPFPWKRVPNFFHNFENKSQVQSLQRGILKTIQISSSFCGIILDKQEYGGAPVPANEYVQQMHQQRLSRTLAQQLIEGEQKWLFYDDQETQILIQIAHSVNQQLITQVIEFLLNQQSA